MAIDSGLDTNILQSTFYLASSLGILIGVPILLERYKNWQDGRKEKSRRLTNDEQTFLNGLDINLGEVALSNQLAEQLPYSSEQLSPFIKDAKSRFDLVMGGYRTLQMCQDRRSEPVSAIVSEKVVAFRSGYSELVCKLSRATA